jgi:hypothetical protein
MNDSASIFLRIELFNTLKWEALANHTKWNPRCRPSQLGILVTEYIKIGKSIRTCLGRDANYVFKKLKKNFVLKFNIIYIF